MKVFILFTLIITLSIVLDFIYDGKMWNLNTKFTEYLQKQNIFEYETIIFRLISMLIYIPPTFGVLMFIFSFQKINSMLYIFNVIVVLVVNGILKNIYHQARPYMKEDSIEALSCSSEFGKPSGHAQSSIIFFYGYLYIFMNGIINHQQKNVADSSNQSDKSILYENIKENHNNIDPIKRTIIFILITIVVILVGLSRVYLGVHSFEQVLLGWIFGIYQIIIYHYFIHQEAQIYFLRQFQIEQVQKFRSAAYLFTTIFISLTIINVVLLELNKNMFNSQKDLQNWVDKLNICKQKQYTLNDNNVLYNHCFLQSTLFIFIAAFFQGCQFSQGTHNEIILINEYITLQMKQRILRYVLYIPAVFILALYLIKWKNVYMTALFTFFPILIVLALYITCLHPYLLLKFNLQVKGDFLEMRNSQYQSLLD